VDEMVIGGGWCGGRRWSKCLLRMVVVVSWCGRNGDKRLME